MLLTFRPHNPTPPHIDTGTVLPRHPHPTPSQFHQRVTSYLNKLSPPVHGVSNYPSSRFPSYFSCIPSMVAHSPIVDD